MLLPLRGMETYFPAVGALSNVWEKRIRFAVCNYAYASYFYRLSSLFETKTPSAVRSGNLGGTRILRLRSPSPICDANGALPT